MSKRPSIFGATKSAQLPPEAQAADAAEVLPTTTAAKGEGEMFRTSLYISRAVHNTLREISFHERCKVHELLMEGIDEVLTKRGYATSDELRKSAKA